MITPIPNRPSKKCQWVRRLLDDFENGELGVEANQEILLHLEGCPECTRLAEQTRSLRKLLSKSWDSQPIPDSLREDVLVRLQRRRFRLSWLTPIAAGIAIVALFYAGPQVGGRLSNWTVPGTEWSVAGLFYGYQADDIVHAHKQCNGTGILEEHLLPLQPRLLEDVEGFEVVTAHECETNGRKIFHFVLAESGQQFSLILEETPSDPNGVGFSTLPGARQVAPVGSTQVWRAVRSQTAVTYLNSDRFQIYLLGSQETRVGQLMEKLISPLQDGLT